MSTFDYQAYLRGFETASILYHEQKYSDAFDLLGKLKNQYFTHFFDPNCKAALLRLMADCQIALDQPKLALKLYKESLNEAEKPSERLATLDKYVSALISLNQIGQVLNLYQQEVKLAYTKIDELETEVSEYINMLYGSDE